MFKRRHFLMNAADDQNSGSGGSGSGDQNSGSGDQANNQGKTGGTGDNQTMTLEEAQKVIKDLRAEAAKYRTEKNNLSTRLEKLEKGIKAFAGGDENDQEDTETKFGKLQGEFETLSVRNTMYELAFEHGISKDDFEYFEFLMSKKLNSLEEGAEMTEEDLTEILGGLKSKGGGKAPANTSTGTGTGTKPNPDGKSGDVTLEQFVKMGMMDKSKLFQTKPELYNSLLTQAKQKGLI